MDRKEKKEKRKKSKSSSKSKEGKERKQSKQSKQSKSGVRTKFLIESLRQDYYALRDENTRLRELVQSTLPKDAADALLAECFDVNAPQAKVSNIDELASKEALAEGDEEDDDF